MRIISQNGKFDLPYEDTVIHTEYFKTEPRMVVAIFKGEKYTLGTYSTEEKAIKAMKMLREQYSRLEIIKILASGTCEHMEESLKPEEFNDILEKYINMEVFQFPQDDEIEV